MTEALSHPFGASEYPFPHENRPPFVPHIEAPDPALAFHFNEQPSPEQAAIEGPDLTDPDVFEWIPRTHAQLMDHAKREGRIPADADSAVGPTVEGRSLPGSLDTTDDAETVVKRGRGRPPRAASEPATSEATPESAAESPGNAPTMA